MKAMRYLRVGLTIGLLVASPGFGPGKRAQAQDVGIAQDRKIESSVRIKTDSSENPDGNFGGVRVIEPDKAEIPEGVEIQVPWESSAPPHGEGVRTKPRHIIRQKRAPMRNWKFDAPATKDPGVSPQPPNYEPAPKLRSPSHYPEGIQNPRIPWYEKGPPVSPRGATGR